MSLPSLITDSWTWPVATTMGELGGANHRADIGQPMSRVFSVGGDDCGSEQEELRKYERAMGARSGALPRNEKVEASMLAP